MKDKETNEIILKSVESQTMISILKLRQQREYTKDEVKAIQQGADIALNEMREVFEDWFLVEEEGKT